MDHSHIVPQNIGELIRRLPPDLDQDQGHLPVGAGSDGGASKPPVSKFGLARPSGLEILSAQHSLARFATLYISTEVYGIQAKNTLQAKVSDIGGFIRWFVATNGHGEIRDWMPRDTMTYLLHVEKRDKKASATINRIFASLRHFARWVHDQPGNIFSTHGLPTRGIKELSLDEPDCKKLSKVEIHRLFRAADTLCMTETKSMQRPRRNRAVFAVLYSTGLRVSELIALERHQYDGKYLTDVKRKGRGRTRGLYLVSETRIFLDEYLATERHSDNPKGVFQPLFLADASGNIMKRQRIREGLLRLGQEAGKHSHAPILVYPHRLRHTFGAEYREKTGSDTETASALGHASLKYVGRYVRKTAEERETTLESIFSSTLKH